MYFDDCETLRTKAGLSVSSIAKKTGLDRGTIKNVEKHKNARVETLHSILNALNELHYTEKKQELDAETLITQFSKYGATE